MVAHIIEIVGAWIISVISSAGYIGIMLLMAIESACIPLPSEIIMPFSGYLVYTGRFSLFWVATSARSAATWDPSSPMRLATLVGVRWSKPMGGTSSSASASLTGPTAFLSAAAQLPS